MSSVTTAVTLHSIRYTSNNGASPVIYSTCDNTIQICDAIIQTYEQIWQPSVYHSKTFIGRSTDLRTFLESRARASSADERLNQWFSLDVDYHGGKFHLGAELLWAKIIKPASLPSKKAHDLVTIVHTVFADLHFVELCKLYICTQIKTTTPSGWFRCSLFLIQWRYLIFTPSQLLCQHCFLNH